MQGVKGMEKLLLGSVLAGKKLNIIDKKDIYVAVFISEVNVVLVLDCVDEFIGEFFTGHIDHFFGGRVGENIISNGLHKMGCPEANTPIDKKGIVAF